MRFMAALCSAAVVVFGQTNRTLEFTGGQSRQELEQMAMVLRAIADAAAMSIDEAKHTLVVSGTGAQIDTAAWLARQLDLPANPAAQGAREYRPAGGGDDLVRVFHVSHAPEPAPLQEMATLVRSIGDIRRLFVYAPRSAIAARGTSQQIALAAWILEQIDLPPDAPVGNAAEFRLPGNELARVFVLANSQTPQQLQEMATLIRAIGDIGRLFVYQGRPSVAVRAPAEQIALAGWLIRELDKPLSAIAGPQDASLKHEYWLQSSPENLVRVFYLPLSLTVQELQQLASEARRTSGVRRVFLYNRLRAVAVRGTVGQVSALEQSLSQAVRTRM